MKTGLTNAAHKNRMPKPITKPEQLTVNESVELTTQEQIIQRGLGSFVAVGNALLVIRDAKLYRESHGTFEAYLSERWKMSIRHADRMMVATRTVDALSETGPTGPVSERQVRPLTQLETPEQQREAWSAAVEATGGKPTAKDVEAAVEVVKGNIRPFPEPALTDEEKERVSEAEKDSENLWTLKSYWKRASKKERAEFRVWIDKH